MTDRIKPSWFKLIVEVLGEEMGSKRELDGGSGNASEDGGLEFEPKRRKVVLESSAAADNSLLPGFNYGDDEEDEELAGRFPSDGRGEGGGDKKRNGENAIREAEEEAEDDEDYPYDQGFGLGKRSREIDIRRDCPYLDTVNRQVF